MHSLYSTFRNAFCKKFGSRVVPHVRLSVSILRTRSGKEFESENFVLNPRLVLSFNKFGV